MKKFLAIVIVLTILFALAIPVLAAGDGPSVSRPDAGDGPITPTSPQTGFEWIGWAAAAAIAILCAGCCFARAKKSR